MWLILTVVHGFFSALVNYIDEYLTSKTTIQKEQSIHKKIGWVLLISSLFTIISVIVLSFFISDFQMTDWWLWLSLFSSIPMVIMFACYFYLFQKFPAQQVVPLFWLSSIWLLLLELSTGDAIGILPLVWVLFLLYGSYVLDTNVFYWKLPTKLLLIMMPVSFLWSCSLFLAEYVSKDNSILHFFFFQSVGIFIIGVMLFILVRSYREWLLERIRDQWKIFVWWSALNEFFAQISFFAAALAVSIAPLATYVSAVWSVAFIFLFIFLFLFPVTERNRIWINQCISIFIMIIWILLIEIFK